MLEAVVPAGKDPLRIAVVAHVRCRELDGAHFDTDKSFVRPDALPTLSEIGTLLAGDSNRRGIIFGHTDTVGAEDYNKLLSERRAKAIFAALIHSPAEWEDLYNREKWGIARIQVMLRTVSQPGDPEVPDSGQLDEPTKTAVKRFQKNHPPLDIDGDPGPKTRRELFKAYFAKGANPPADATRFVVFGSSAFMGCGEFNPFTEGAADEASRRVTVQVFDRAAEPKDLPCKIGDIAPCKANLLALGEAPPATDDPKMQHFRCKIFRAIERRCNAKPPVPPPPKLSNGTITRVDADGEEIQVTILGLSRKPVAEGTDVTVEAGEFRTFVTTAKDGKLKVKVPTGTKDVTLSYQPPDTTARVTNKVKLELAPASDDQGALDRLTNLGYAPEADKGFAILSFQRDQGLEPTMTLDGPTRDKLRQVYGS